MTFLIDEFDFYGAKVIAEGVKEVIFRLFVARK